MCYNRYEVVFIRPDLIEDDLNNDRGMVLATNDNLIFVSNLNMPFMGTINTWFTEHEISREPWEV